MCSLKLIIILKQVLSVYNVKALLNYIDISSMKSLSTVFIHKHLIILLKNRKLILVNIPKSKPVPELSNSLHA